jgi:hypothetical protein
MAILHDHIKAADYIRNLQFERLETYSLQRGEDYEAKIAEMWAERNRLNVRQQKRGDLSHEKLERLDSLNELDEFA